jgi:hypothetical protein
VHVDLPEGGFVSWEFFLESNDINFGVLRFPLGGALAHACCIRVAYVLHTCCIRAAYVLHTCRMLACCQLLIAVKFGVLCLCMYIYIYIYIYILYVHMCVYISMYIYVYMNEYLRMHFFKKKIERGGRLQGWDVSCFW